MQGVEEARILGSCYFLDHLRVNVTVHSAKGRDTGRDSLPREEPYLQPAGIVLPLHDHAWYMNP